MFEIQMVGNLTQNPTIRKVKVGDAEVSVCNFYIACNEGYGEHRKTWYPRITCWRQQAEVMAKYLTKGSKVYVRGTVSAQPWKAQDGSLRATLEVTADKIEIETAQKREEAPADPQLPADDFDAADLPWTD
jgi:single-strand DNA-binding protein